MDSKQKEKFGDWLMDIAKYMLTALVLSSVLIDMKNPLIFVIVIFFTVVVFFIGLRFVKEEKNKK